MEYIIGLILGIVGKILNNEIEAWTPLISKRIIEKAVRCLPQYEQERFREEWLAHLNECPSSVSRLWHAIGCVLSSRMLAASHPPANNLHLIGAITVALGFGACRWSNWFVIVVFVGLFLNWWREPAEGSRGSESIRHGFFVDDAERLSAYTLMIIGLGFSPYLTVGSALLFLSQYLLRKSYNYLRIAVMQKHVFTEKTVSTVDLRVLMALWVIAAICLGPNIMTRIAGLNAIDIASTLISVVSFLIFVGDITADLESMRED